MNLQRLQSLLKSDSIQVISFSTHSKASEKYVEVCFQNTNGEQWNGLVPFYYRRTGVFIETEEELARYLEKIEPYFNMQSIKNWVEAEKLFWETNHDKKEVTKLFFEELIKLEWITNFPANRNPQRRLQDIKELGYTIASRSSKGRQLEFLLLPIPRGTTRGYETFSAAFRKKALKALNHLNVFELSSANKAGLLPDHKFPENRWDAETREENPETMTEEEISLKFQLLDNQRNQQKREVCRACFQTNKRGIIFGINYFYKGDENWNTNFLNQELETAKIGKNAEIGCIGCGWYDIRAWRLSLNQKLNSELESALQSSKN